MVIQANNFVWVNKPSPNAQPETVGTTEPLADDFANLLHSTAKAIPKEVAKKSEFINLTPDGTLKLERSQYVEDMVGEESSNSINKK